MKVNLIKEKLMEKEKEDTMMVQYIKESLDRAKETATVRYSTRRQGNGTKGTGCLMLDMVKVHSTQRKEIPLQ